MNMKKRRYYHRIALFIGAAVLGINFGIMPIQVEAATKSNTIIGLAAAKTDTFSHVDANNFLDYFKLNGSAEYDSSQGIVTITPDKNDQVGNFALKSKIDMNTSFDLTGQVNLGDKTSENGGADGIGFAFHNGNVDDIGNAGGNLGIGNLIDALGFKLDTWHNSYYQPQAAIPGSQVLPEDSNGYGWAGDPQNPQFGAFVTTSLKEINAFDGNDYDRWWAETDTSSVQDLDATDLDGQFHDFNVNYDGSTRELTIKYTQANGKTLTWKKIVPTSDEAMAMIVSASTGGAKNLQQFKLIKFDYQQAATVNVRYLSTTGRQVGQASVEYPAGAIVGGEYKTEQLDIPNYHFVRMDDDGKVSGTPSLPATGTLNTAGDNGTIVYLYEPEYQIDQKIVNETIHYVDEDGNSVADDYQAKPITFITVKNPTTSEAKEYFAVGKQDKPMVTSDGIPISQNGVQWFEGNKTSFGAVNHPEVDGYKVISNDAPDGDLMKVSAQAVHSDSSDLVFTVVYSKDPEKPVDP